LAKRKPKPKPLIIVESPTKARTISRAFGRRYQVQASLGHLRDLPRSRLGVDVDNDFEPRYITVRGRGDVVKELRTAARKADTVLLAADPDREGEAISWHLAHLLGLDPTGPCRIVFHEITKEAVAEALRHPRAIDMNLVDAQQARRVLDRLVGYELSPLLWRKVRRGLSAGRVQSVAVMLICDREAEIREFEPEEYWTVTALLAPTEEGEPTFEARFAGRPTRDGRAEKVELANAEEADKVVSGARNAKWTVLTVKRGKRRRRPSAPYTTSSLQQDAGSRLGFSVRKTMILAQQLYEGVELGRAGPVGLITYMRTDATRVAESARAQVRAVISGALGDEYLPAKPPRHKKGKRAQEAHEAIRPTDPARTPASVRLYLDADQFRLYRLIWERFTASEMAPAVYDTVTAEFDADGWLFRSSGSALRFPGFLAASDLAAQGLPEEDQAGEAGAGEPGRSDADEDGLVLPRLEGGQRVTLVDITPEQHFTAPPPRYTEASLVRAMEESGIGRPSTYAPTVETILTRGYVERDEGRLIPTKLGRIVTDLLTKHFPDVIDVEFTAELEEQLDEVEDGALPWRKVVRNFYEPFASALEAAEEKLGRVEVPEEEVGIDCEACGRPMVVKYGRYGRFLACSGYPECRETKPFSVPTGVSCPQCGAQVVEKRTRKGRRFYGCIRYPECDFSAWSRPVDKRCPECGGVMVVAGRGGRAGEEDGRRRVRCVSKECGHVEFESREGSAPERA